MVHWDILPDLFVKVWVLVAVVVPVQDVKPDTELSTYVLFAASVPEDTVSTPCMRPVPPNTKLPLSIVSPSANFQLPLKYNLSLVSEPYILNSPLAFIIVNVEPPSPSCNLIWPSMVDPSVAPIVKVSLSVNFKFSSTVPVPSPSNVIIPSAVVPVKGNIPVAPWLP